MTAAETCASPELAPTDLLIQAKFQAGYGVVMETLGNMNQAYAASLLYDAVFYPNQVIAQHAIGPSDRFPDRIDVLQAAVPIVAVPDRDSFVAQICDAVTREIDHDRCLYPGALDAVASMICKGPTAIWTQGDIIGYGAHAPGSYEQIKKVGLSSLADVRRELWLGRLVTRGDETLAELNDGLTLVAGEDKFSPGALEQLRFYFRSQGVSELVILEDRLPNLQKLQGLLEAGEELHVPSFSTRGIWVRQGQYAARDQEFDASKVMEVPSIADAQRVISGMEWGYGFITDFDGVLSDQPTRLMMQAASVQAVFWRNGWV